MFLLQLFISIKKVWDELLFKWKIACIYAFLHVHMLKRQELFWGSGSKALAVWRGQHVYHWSSYYRIHNKYVCCWVACWKAPFWATLTNFKISFHFTLDHNITNCHLLLGRSNQSHYSRHHVKGYLGCSVLPKGASSCRLQGSRIKQRLSNYYSYHSTCDFQILGGVVQHQSETGP